MVASRFTASYLCVLRMIPRVLRPDWVTTTPPFLCRPVPCCNQSLSYITLSILGGLSHVILASFVLYIRVHYGGIFRF